MPAGDSHGFWAPGDGTLREFDEQFDCGPDRPNSRSRRIVEAIRLLKAVYEVFESEGVEPKDERHVRMATVSALRRAMREDADG